MKSKELYQNLYDDLGNKKFEDAFKKLNAMNQSTKSEVLKLRFRGSTGNNLLASALLAFRKLLIDKNSSEAQFNQLIKIIIFLIKEGSDLTALYKIESDRQRENLIDFIDRNFDEEALDKVKFPYQNIFIILKMAGINLSNIELYGKAKEQLKQAKQFSERIMPQEEKLMKKENETFSDIAMEIDPNQNFTGAVKRLEKLSEHDRNIMLSMKYPRDNENMGLLAIAIRQFGKILNQTPNDQELLQKASKLIIYLIQKSSIESLFNVANSGSMQDDIFSFISKNISFDNPQPQPFQNIFVVLRKAGINLEETTLSTNKVEAKSEFKTLNEFFAKKPNAGIYLAQSATSSQQAALAIKKICEQYLINNKFATKDGIRLVETNYITQIKANLFSHTGQSGKDRAFKLYKKADIFLQNQNDPKAKKELYQAIQEARGSSSKQLKSDLLEVLLPGDFGRVLRGEPEKKASTGPS